MADIKFLELLSKDYPNIKAATAEIINLSAILALPKGTEYFLSDLHGEHEAFVHMLKSASGTIKSKIDEHYGGILSESDREDLAALIYNPQAELARRKKSEPDFDKWCMTVIYRLVTICKSVSTKYTRSKMRWMNCFMQTMKKIGRGITALLSIQLLNQVLQRTSFLLWLRLSAI